MKMEQKLNIPYGATVTASTANRKLIKSKTISKTISLVFLTA